MPRTARASLGGWTDQVLNHDRAFQTSFLPVDLVEALRSSER
jgi:hypothetical protein